MDILDNIEQFIPENTRERGIVIENDELIKSTFVNPNISKSHYVQVEGDVKNIPTTLTTNVANEIASKVTSVQSMHEDSWENIEHSIGEWAEFRELVESGMTSKDAVNKIIMDSTVGIPEVKRGGRSSKKSKNKRKIAKASRKKNRKR